MAVPFFYFSAANEVCTVIGMYGAASVAARTVYVLIALESIEPCLFPFRLFYIVFVWLVSIRAPLGSCRLAASSQPSDQPHSLAKVVQARQGMWLKSLCR
jgi:hypothetical protein